ncbi:MAG: carboxypeptidase regulatory-like domain-containing protein, partial [Chloroflexi bacterium]|nr:carboxypeptidase regulatory-like domain-containing protein [Chloroflexota bacterium]
GYAFSPAVSGTNTAIDSNPNATTGLTPPITLVAGQNEPTIDAGLWQPASLGDLVWLDTNQNGIQDVGETGVAGVVVTLFDSAGNQIAVTTTNASGNYLFTNLTPGTYSIGFTPPTGYIFSPAGQGGNPTTDSNPNINTGRTGLINLAAGQNDLTVDAGIFPSSALASLGDFVWLDANHNGIQDPGEVGVPNVLVTLYDGSGQQIAQVPTDGTGHYQFTNLRPGQYAVNFTAPAGYNFTSQGQGGNPALDSNADFNTGSTPLVTLVAGQNDPTIDAGLWQPASLGDFVWNDTNRNGIQDAGETGIANVVVYLYRSDGTLLATTTTDSNGYYLFTNLVPGSYYVVFTPPAGYIISPPNQGGDLTKDSNPNSNGQTTTITLVSGENNLTLDAGMSLQPNSGGSGNPAPITTPPAFNPPSGTPTQTVTTTPEPGTETPPVPIVTPTPEPDSGSSGVTRTVPYILKVADRETVYSGQVVKFTITVVNPSNTEATNVVVTDNVPDKLVVKGATTSQGNVTVKGQNVTVDIGTLAPGATVTIVVTTQARDGIVGSVSNTATLSGEQDGILFTQSGDTTAVATVTSIPKLPNTGFKPAESNPLERWKPSTASTVQEGVSDLEMFGKPLSSDQTTWANHASLPALQPGAGPVMPVRLRIPALGVDTEIEGVGLRNGAMDVPSNIWNASWLNTSPRPGDVGNAVLAGHKNSVHGSAIFMELGKLQPGDKIYVSDMYGYELTFEVFDVQSYLLQDAPLGRIFGPSSEKQLNLISCDGNFIREQLTYNKRIVVYTRLSTNN